MPINATPREGLVFRVQIGAFVKPVSNDAFKGFTPISGEKIPGSKWVRYMAGYFTNFDLADDAKKQIRQIKGFSDAFVVAFYNGEKISITEARRLYEEGDAEQLAKKNEIVIPEGEKVVEKETEVVVEETEISKEETNTTREETVETKEEVVEEKEVEVAEKENLTETKVEIDTTKEKTNKSDVEEKLKNGEPVNFNDLQNVVDNSLNVRRSVEQTSAGIIVSLTINNVSGNGFAKIEEEIPTGFRAEALTTASALFTQKGNKVLFVWEDLTSKVTEIRYALYPSENVSSGRYRIDGLFVPEFEEQIQVKPISYFVYQTKEVTATTEKETEVEKETAEEIKTEIIEEETNTNKTLEEIQNVTLNPDKAAYYSDVKNAAEAEQVEVIKGLFFTVQIGVYSKPVPSSSLFNIVPLNTELIRAGLIRYTTGQFGSLDAASVRKDEIRLIGVQDAFVTAYFNGERITIVKAKEILTQYGEEILVK